MNLFLAEVVFAERPRTPHDAGDRAFEAFLKGAVGELRKLNGLEQQDKDVIEGKLLEAAMWLRTHRAAMVAQITKTAEAQKHGGQ